jgi:hypothetical protein
MARYYSYGAGRIIPVPGGIRTAAFPRRFLKNVEIMTETYCGTKQNRFVLLHELGHLTGVLGDDSGDNQSKADSFNQKILNDCFGVKNWQPPQ